MPETRDRLSRQVDFISSYSRRRNSRIGRVSLTTFVLEDENEGGQATRTPFRWRDTSMVDPPGPMGVIARGGATGSPRIRRIAPIEGPENLSPVVGSGRGRGSPLPIWYPRRPLNDITAVVRAIERRGERRRDDDGLESTTDISMITPRPMMLGKRCQPTVGKVPKILLNITHKVDEDSACLTPQKTLLNNIDTVEKMIMEELQKLKRTPSGKRAEREKRVRTLMSMR